jgi:hypothetical protein
MGKGNQNGCCAAIFLYLMLGTLFLKLGFSQPATAVLTFAIPFT